MTPDSGYAKAKQLLHEHFGNKYKITTAYLERALSWPSIKGEDASALQSYALFLHGCCNVTKELQYLQELDMPSNIRIRIRMSFIGQVCLHIRGICYSDSSTVQQNDSNRTGHRHLYIQIGNVQNSKNTMQYRQSCVYRSDMCKF